MFLVAHLLSEGNPTNRTLVCAFLLQIYVYAGIVTGIVTSN